MKKLFAVPTVNEKLSAHFGHCEKFVIIETEDKKVTNENYVTTPVHQPGVYPQFLAQQGVSTIISGGMGQRAQNLFAKNKIEVCVGVGSDSPQILVEKYLSDELKTGQNLCDH
jgi:predicted Fe-Mo cluster-binding NifX family protein